MTIPEILTHMEYGPAPEDPALARDWLDRHRAGFGHFIGGAMTDPGATDEIRDPARDEALAQVARGTPADVDAAVAAARAARGAWAALGGPGRARHLHALAAGTEARARLLALLGTLETGRPFHPADVTAAVGLFHHHAGWATLAPDEFPGLDPWGVCAQLAPSGAPLATLVARLAPALAAGSAVVLKPGARTPLTALALAAICAGAGLPAGVLNIVAGDAETGAALAGHAGVDKVSVTGTAEAAARVRRRIAGTGRGLSLDPGGAPRVIVLDDADLDAAVEGVADAAWRVRGPLCCAGARVLVAESVAQGFAARLGARMDGLVVGDPLDRNTDIGAVIDPLRRDRIRDRVAAARAEGVAIRAGQAPQGCYHPPVLATGVAPASLLWSEPLRGPIVTVTSFRTPAEAVDLANDIRDGHAAAIWSADGTLCLDLAGRVRAGHVGVNCMVAPCASDATAGSGGGRAGMAAELRAPRAAGAPGTLAPPDPLSAGAAGGPAAPGGGGDILGAVAAAAAARAWGGMTGAARAHRLRVLAEGLSDRRAEFADRLAGVGDRPPDDAEAEVSAAIRRIVWYAALADTAGGAAHRGRDHVTLTMPEPLGIMGLVCPTGRPLLGLVSLLMPALAAGNRVVAVPSPTAPLAAVDLGRAVAAADLPPGVVNVVTGPRDDLARTLARHDGVDGIWYVGSAGAMVEAEAAGNLTPTWTEPAGARDWMGPEGQGRDFLHRATRSRTIRLACGA